MFYRNFVPKTHCFFIDIRLRKCCDLENRVRGSSRSLEVSPFDGAHMTSYWRSIWLYLVSFLKYSMSKNVVTLISESKVIQGHRKWYHSIWHPWVPINVPVTIGLSHTVSEIIGDLRRKSQIFGPLCILRPRWRGSPWNWVSALGS